MTQDKSILNLRGADGFNNAHDQITTSADSINSIAWLDLSKSPVPVELHTVLELVDLFR